MTQPEPPPVEALHLSVVIPAFNEAESLSELVPAVAAVARRLEKPFEIWVVDDGSTDGTVQVIARMKDEIPEVGVLRLRRNFGKSAALTTAFRRCRGRYVVTMDADLQDDPEEIPLLLQDLEGGLDLVSGWKKVRHDPLSKTLPSRFFNRVTSWVSGVRLHDFNCGLKGYRAEVVRTIALYGEMHRFIPVLANREGFKIGERVVHHHARRYGRSKFGSSRFVNGFLDLLEVMFLAGGRRTPLHVFGRFGALCLAAGSAINVYMLAIWILEGRLRVRPLLILGVILIILGIQFISIGLLAALIHAPASQDRTFPVVDAIEPTVRESSSSALPDRRGTKGPIGEAAEAAREGERV